MDMVMVDVTAIPGVAVGDEVVLIGQQGKSESRPAILPSGPGPFPTKSLCDQSADSRLYDSA